LDKQRAPATPGSRSASSALAAAQETLGNRNTPALFKRSPSSTFGSENRRTTLIASPTMYTLNMTPPTNDKSQNKRLNGTADYSKETDYKTHEHTMVNKFLKNQGGLKFGQ
jgi:hypothetical protein